MFTAHITFNDGTEPLCVQCDTIDWGNHICLAYQADGWWHLIPWARINAYKYQPSAE